MKFLARWFLPLTLLGAIIVLLAGYAGGVHPIGDSVAVLRLYAMLVLLLFAIGSWVRSRKFVAWLCIILLGFSGFGLRHQLIPATHEGSFSLLQSNLLFMNNASALVGFAAEEQPDIITLQEVTTGSIPQLAKMRGQYPYQVICPFAGVGGVAILSRFKILGPQGEGCAIGKGLVSARVETPDGVFTLVSLHLNWPWPHSQPRHLAGLLPVLEALEGPVIVAGDFNMVPWGQSIRQVEITTNTVVTAGLRFSKTMFAGVAQLPIDHVLLPVGWQGASTRGPQLGSDHYSIITRFTPVFNPG